MSVDNYDLAVVREMLDEAFSVGEINTLAFDLFPKTYRDFPGDWSKSRRIREIVSDADNQGRIPDLLAYTEKHNAYRYGLFAPRLKKNDVPVTDPNRKRRQDLENHIAREQQLLNQYREQLTYMSDPRTMAGIEANIRRQQETLARYQKELAELVAALSLHAPANVTPPEEIVEETLKYVAEEQAWYPARFPAVANVTGEPLARLQNEIEVVVMVATEVELRATLNKLEPLPRRKHILRTYIGAETYYLGQFGLYKTAVTRCRMGSGGEGASTLATNSAIRNWKPRAIIMPGIAFGKSPSKQKIADVLVASQIIPYENQRRGTQKIIFRAAIPPSNATLQNRFINALDWYFERPDGLPCSLLVGPILSGAKLVDDPQFKASLFNEFSEAIGGEMEGAGLADAAGQEGTPWILTKAICDWGDGKKHGKHQPLAAAASVSLVHHILSQPDVLPNK